jgi:hypothetical protein
MPIVLPMSALRAVRRLAKCYVVRTPLPFPLPATRGEGTASNDFRAICQKVRCAQTVSSFFHPLPMPTFWTVWNNLPSVLMLGAMMISVS